jgi:hypothetical protein
LRGWEGRLETRRWAVSGGRFEMGSARHGVDPYSTQAGAPAGARTCPSRYHAAAGHAGSPGSSPSNGPAAPGPPPPPSAGAALPLGPSSTNGPAPAASAAASAPAAAAATPPLSGGPSAPQAPPAPPPAQDHGPLAPPAPPGPSPQLRADSRPSPGQPPQPCTASARSSRSSARGGFGSPGDCTSSGSGTSAAVGMYLWPQGAARRSPSQRATWGGDERRGQSVGGGVNGGAGLATDSVRLRARLATASARRPLPALPRRGRRAAAAPRPHPDVGGARDERHAALLQRARLLVPRDRDAVLADAGGLQRVARPRVALGQALGRGGGGGLGGRQTVRS